jgi:hypothetical protein
MDDPRLNGDHLAVARHDQYDATIEEMLDDRGPTTSEADPLVRLPKIFRISGPSTSLLPAGTYFLINLTDCRRHKLRVGINTMGRFPENDLVVDEHCISRRHCVILVHASGKCEVYDTASRNGTLVNRRRIGRTDLFPGDILKLCSQNFLVAWIGQSGEVLSDAALPESELAGETRQLNASKTD